MSRRDSRIYDISKERLETLIAYSGSSFSVISEATGIPRTTLHRYAGKLGLGGILRNRKYDFDESYFADIDTEQKAYWLGFISADGCVTNNSMKLAIGLGDIGHLYKIKIDIRSSHPVKIADNGHTGIAVLNISSMSMRRDLIKHGVVPAKSLIIEPCKSIPVDLSSHYWRGVFDGDGSIYPVNRETAILTGNSIRWGICLVGSAGMILGWSRFACPDLDRGPSIAQHGNVWRADFRSFDSVHQVLNKMYGKATVFLDRKMSLYRNISVEEKTSHHKRCDSLGRGRFCQTVLKPRCTVT